MFFKRILLLWSLYKLLRRWDKRKAQIYQNLPIDLLRDLKLKLKSF